MSTQTDKPIDFIRAIVAEDVSRGTHGGLVVTRFPPEPNGFLHVGHAKSICLNFGIAQEFGGRCHLRYDDTNPTKEEQKYIDAIKEDIRWLGFEWSEHEYYASDYFEQLYEWAIAFIKAGKAFVCDMTAEEVRLARGTATTPGKESPFRNRSVAENLDLFERMKRGEFPDGTRTLRAKIDMASPNFNLRDPVMYRILHAHHPRTGNAWCIYPMYDWAHGESDWIEGITHSICTLEFEDHRPLYDWFVETLIELGLKPRGVEHRPRQYEFARLNLTNTVMSKRRLLELVNEGHVRGWDDPRMPTISGMRRRGYTPEAIRDMCAKVGVTKYKSLTDVAFLENSVRDHLNKVAPRYMAVLDPVKVVIENYPEGQSEELDAVNNPEDEGAGRRKVPFSREIFIEREDFAEVPPPKFFRLTPGREVRLRWAYFITCTNVVKDDRGEITEIRATYDRATKGGDAPDGRKVKGTLHWLSATHAHRAEMRLYDRLFRVEKPGEERDWRLDLNPDSLRTIDGFIEPALARAKSGDRVQFERIGYFCVDPDSTVGGRIVFNRTVGLRDSWAKAQQK
jgi:glutaminyl-tRNA synthetase